MTIIMTALLLCWFALFALLVVVVPWISTGVVAVEADAEENDSKDNEQVSKDFFFACSGGQVDKVQVFLMEHADWANATTPEGESCLHLAAIPGSEALTRLLLQEPWNANPNVRTTFDGGLRMHPLSWNVYGLHYESIKLLLEHGAQVNADVDSGDGTVITALDATLKFLEQPVDSSADSSTAPANPYRDRAEKIHKLLLQYGAKTFDELQKEL